MQPLKLCINIKPSLQIPPSAWVLKLVDASWFTAMAPQHGESSYSQGTPREGPRPSPPSLFGWREPQLESRGRNPAESMTIKPR